MNDPHDASPPRIPPALDVPIDAEIVSEAVPSSSQAPDKPRLWTVWMIVVVVIVFSLQVNLISVVVAQWFVLGTVSAPDDGTLLKLMESRIGFCLMLIPSQLAILIPPLIAAYASPQPFRQRLGLVRGHWPLWAWIAGGIATPLIGLITTLVLSPFIEASEHLNQMTDAFRAHANGGFLIATLLMVGGMPAICEEILFRGYIQTRLAKRLPAVAAVLIASVLFAVFHFDPVHVIAVLPIGLWLGFLRGASGSILPAMIAHAINNTLSVISVMPEQTDVMDAPSTWLTLGLLGLGIPCLLATIAASRFFAAPLRMPQT
ncbi:CAAX amino terminal protease self- immunity [Rosistilla carotiformis]|uniref:CAAX amino terminal protease self-immunity n=1 Tax=Rosistilla carotiformis TaxID=2528017 RepID=A0A518JTC5_9BACT|nr:CPBP family intramembrane glutamic endopeptidase [Rosistilla carotiformis]QDV68801.1 CAAX amino terminal protease self- immunity [Rosistilla carotiformis]